MIWVGRHEPGLRFLNQWLGRACIYVDLEWQSRAESWVWWGEGEGEREWIWIISGGNSWLPWMLGLRGQQEWRDTHTQGYRVALPVALDQTISVSCSGLGLAGLAMTCYWREAVRFMKWGSGRDELCSWQTKAINVQNFISGKNVLRKRKAGNVYSRTPATG